MSTHLRGVNPANAERAWKAYIVDGVTREDFKARFQAEPSSFRRHWKRMGLPVSRQEYRRCKS